MTILLGIGIPNYFTIYDTSSLSSGVDVNVKLRVLTALLLSIVVFLKVLQSNFKAISIHYQNLTPIILIGYALFLFIYKPSSFSYTDLYRIYEITLLCVSASIIISTVKEIELVLKCISAYLVLNLIIMLLFFPGKAEIFTGRFGGSVIHPNSLSVMLLLLCLNTRFVYGRQFFYTAGLIALPFLVLTASRFGLVIFTLIYFLDLMTMFKQRTLAAIVLCVCFVTLGSFLIEKLTSILMRGDSIDYLLSGAGRFAVWYSALQIITSNLSNLIFGVGFSSATEQVNEILQNELAIHHWKVPNAHNEYLQIMLSFGIIGSIIYLKLLYKTFVSISEVQYIKYRSSFYLMLITIMLYGLTWTTTSYYLNFCTLYMVILWHAYKVEKI